MSETFGQILKKKRKAKGFKKRELADKVNISPSSITWYEKDKSTPNLFVGVDIANALDCSVYELCGVKEFEQGGSDDGI